MKPALKGRLGEPRCVVSKQGEDSGLVFSTDTHTGASAIARA